LSVLVNDLLDISRLEGGRVELDIKPLSLKAWWTSRYYLAGQG